jgi:hypothetical protein
MKTFLQKGYSHSQLEEEFEDAEVIIKIRK